MPAPKAEGGIDPQQALRHSGRPANGTLQRTQLGEQTRTLDQVALALRRQAHAAGGSLHQPGTQSRFERRQALADGRTGDTELLGRAAHAALFAEQRKKGDVGKSIHS